MGRSPYLGRETTVDCDACGHDLLDHPARGTGCSWCACTETFTKAQARAIADAETTKERDT